MNGMEWFEVFVKGMKEKKFSTCWFVCEKLIIWTCVWIWVSNCCRWFHKNYVGIWWHNQSINPPLKWDNPLEQTSFGGKEKAKEKKSWWLWNSWQTSIEEQIKLVKFRMQNRIPIIEGTKNNEKRWFSECKNKLPWWKRNGWCPECKTNFHEEKENGDLQNGWPCNAKQTSIGKMKWVIFRMHNQLSWKEKGWVSEWVICRMQSCSECDLVQWSLEFSQDICCLMCGFQI